MAPPSYTEIHEQLCAPGQFFEIEEAAVDGIPTRVWKNAPRTLRDVLIAGLASGNGRDLFILDGEVVTHEQHSARVAALARVLVEEMGVVKGDRVGIAMRNYPEWSVAFWAATAVGAVAVPLNAFWNGAELAFGVDDAEMKVLFADGERLERLAPHVADLGEVKLVGTRLDDRPGHGPLPDCIEWTRLVAGAEAGTSAELPEAGLDVEPDDLATIFYTSGTTGHPKGVLGTHRNICSNLMALMFVNARQRLRDETPPSPSDGGPRVTLLAVPLFHATGCHSMLVSSVFFGGTMVLMRKWDPEVALELIEKHRVSNFGGVPAMLWDVLNSPSLAKRDLSSLGGLGGGGAASPPELMRRVKSNLPGKGASTGYGLTETSSVTTFLGGKDYEARPDSVGVPIPVCEVRIVDEDGNDVPVGERGEIWIKGPNVVPGYWRRPEETAAAFTDGWLHSGDIGRFDEDGFLYIVDRAKDIIIRGGENISSLEVEAALHQHPDVLEVAVFAVPHDKLGEEVGAVVRLRDGSAATVDDLRAHAASLLAPFKVPAHVWLTGEPFPRSGAGKILKREIQARFTAGVA